MFRPSISKLPTQAYTQTINVSNDKYKQYPNKQYPKFLHASHMWHFGESSVARHSRALVTRMLLNAHTLEFFTLSHTQPLHESYLNTGYLIAELQENLAWNKINIWLNKFNLTIYNDSH